MFQKVCDRCKQVMPEPLEVVNWKGPEFSGAIINSVNPYKKIDIHLRRHCAERFIDWLCDGVSMDE